METYSDQDNQFHMLRKILMNQATIVAAINQNGGTPDSAPPTTGLDIICDTAGVAKQGVAQATPNGVLLFGRQGNAKTVYVGGPNVTNGSGSRQGMPLFAGGMPPIRYPVDNVSEIFVNADANGEGISFIIL